MGPRREWGKTQKPVPQKRTRKVIHGLNKMESWG